MMSFTEFIKATSKRVTQLDILIISCIWKLVYLRCQITMNEPATTTRRDKPEGVQPSRACKYQNTRLFFTFLSKLAVVITRQLLH